jgi:histidinol dehydrogenase
MRILEWNSLTASEQAAALQRPALSDPKATAAAAQRIIDAVRRDGDDALRELTRRYDGVLLTNLAVSDQEFAVAERALTPAQHAAIDTAIATVRAFHAAQGAAPLRIETAPGVLCERLSVPVRAVGLYVPAGSAPLPSTAIMLGVPAALAGCPVRVMCTAPTQGGAADPAVLVAARKAGVTQVFKVGGAQAIAAMAYGTATVPKCDKLFGPGNAWVTAAKLLVANDAAGAAADLPAGVTEVMVIADDGARAAFVAADLLAQAEHSSEAQALLVTPSAALAVRVAEEVERQMGALSRAAILRDSIANMRLLVVDSLETAFRIANEYAPEHLLLAIAEPRSWLGQVSAAGAVFLGDWSPESMGDYCSGPNHTLPTYGYAKSYSGLALEDFQKRITVQELTPAGLEGLGPTAQILAGLEGLDAHAAAVTIRLQALARGDESARDSASAPRLAAQSLAAQPVAAQPLAAQPLAAQSLAAQSLAAQPLAASAPRAAASGQDVQAVNPVLALARPDILTLKPYAHAAWLPSLTRLHANEAPWRPAGDGTEAGLNRYPEPQPEALVRRLAGLYGVSPQMLLVTRGSDEAIDLLSRIYLRAGLDAILQCTPTFGMYQVAARIQGAEVIDVPLDRARGWAVDVDRLLAAWQPRVKLVYLCSPNNPTANSLDPAALEAICTALDGKAIVVIDEAYIEWSTSPSRTAWLARFPTLAILRTLSKAHALAGARVGALLGDADMIQLAQRVIPPYWLAQPTIEAALRALRPDEIAASRARLAALLAEREYLGRGLQACRLVEKVWPSDANFLLVDCRDAERCMRASIAGGSIVRDLRANPALPTSLRISVGTRAQNDALLHSLDSP